MQRVNGHTEAAGDGNGFDRPVLRPQERPPGKACTEFVGYMDSLRNIHLGQDYGELLASVAPDEILLANTGAQALADLVQDGITGRVSPGIVNLFEMVKIYEEHGAGMVGAPATSNFFVYASDDSAVIGQAGDGIGDGRNGLLVIESIDLRQQLLLLLHEDALFVVGFLQAGAQFFLAGGETPLLADQRIESRQFASYQADQEGEDGNAQNNDGPVLIRNKVGQPATGDGSPDADERGSAACYRAEQQEPAQAARGGETVFAAVEQPEDKGKQLDDRANPDDGGAGIKTTPAY